MMMVWKCKHFSELTPYELYCMLRLRNEVFVVEQNCVYQDTDNKDQQCYHFCGWDDNTLVAYVRLLPPGTAYEEPSIGRVVTSPSYRRTGAGRILMQKAIELCIEKFGKRDIKIGAQLYLKNFYNSLGFKQCSEMYLEDNIPHILMLYAFS